MRVLFAGGGTGGHLYPGLAVARALVRADPTVKPYFVGAERGIEKEVLPGAGFPFVLLDLHPLYRPKVWRNWRTILGALRSWRTVDRIAKEERPAVVVGTGGYASVLALAYAAVRGIPIVLQEQNSYPGITTRFFARYARQIHLGFPEAARYLANRTRGQLLESGNPIESPPGTRPLRPEARQKWDIPAEANVLLVFGGSQGARAINDVVAEWIKTGLPDNLWIIWATGRGAHEGYAPLDGGRVRVRAYITPMALAYAAADVALARAGAMSTAELAAWGVPPILVPLPTSAADHQLTNARALAETGAGVMIEQSALTVQSLDRAVRELFETPGRLEDMAARILRRAHPDAADDIARKILELTAGG